MLNSDGHDVKPFFNKIRPEWNLPFFSSVHSIRLVGGMECLSLRWTTVIFPIDHNKKKKAAAAAGPSPYNQEL
jgi:hypothetical protein